MDSIQLSSPLSTKDFHFSTERQRKNDPEESSKGLSQLLERDEGSDELGVPSIASSKSPDAKGARTTVSGKMRLSIGTVAKMVLPLRDVDPAACA